MMQIVAIFCLDIHYSVGIVYPIDIYEKDPVELCVWSYADHAPALRTNAWRSIFCVIILKKQSWQVPGISLLNRKINR